MKYVPLFVLELQHDYYFDLRCGDFQVVPTPATQQLLANFRCVLKPLPNGVRVLIQVTEQNIPFIAVPPDTVLCFQLRLQNAEFGLFTDLAAINALAAPVFVNPAADGALGLQAGAVPTAQVVGTASVFAQVNIALGKLIGAPGSALPADGRAFQVRFNAKQCRWKYYVLVNKSTNAGNVPTIVDKDQQIAFDVADRHDLIQVPDPLDTVAAQLARQYPDLQAFRLPSKTLVPCRQSARKGLQLLINGDKVIDALSVPAIQQYVIDVKDAKSEDGLYHIVKYFTQ